MDSRKFVLILAAVTLLALTAVAGIARYHSSGPKTDSKRVNLTDYTLGTAQVRLTTEGPVNADQSHRSSMITIGRDSSSMDTFLTYSNQTQNSQTYPNNQPAFEDFMSALQHAGFTTAQNKASNVDEKGICPKGQRYVYELFDGNTTIIRLWSTSCNDKRETFGGNDVLVQQLFQAQIPDYKTLIKPPKQ